MSQRIKSGMFIMPFHPRDKPLAQCYDEDLEQLILCDELGFDEFWIGEHHTILREAIPLPEAFIARALPETKNIRMGVAPICLNQHNPADVATRLGFLDHLSKGRLNLCFGPGSTASDMELFGVDFKAASEMTREAIEIILKLWTTDWGVGTLVDSPTAYFSSERLSIGLASREPFKSSRGRCSLCRSSI